MTEHAGLKPKAPIRRFDVFAEFNRQKALADGAAADVAKGYGLWLAKVVAARRFGRSLPAGPAREPHPREPEEEAAPSEQRKWRTLDGESQTDALFDKEIVDRMGPAFYEQVFAPAIRRAIQEGRRYETIRDTIRREWKP